MEEAPARYTNMAPQKWWQKWFQGTIDYNQLRDRTIITSLPDPLIPPNKIETSKYNYVSFIPINIVEQFTKLANIYFLFIGILQAVPAISLSEGRPTIFIPLFLVVIISMVKDFIQDLKRHRNDEKQNESEIQVLTQNGFARRRWEDVQVGQIIRVQRDGYFPCDVILLDHNKEQKTSFIQTKNLDGQTNLKLKLVNQHLRPLRALPQLDLWAVRLQFSFEKPNPFLSTFNGNVKLGEKKFMIQNSNVVLRGCSLKINEWAVGMCVYTGHETKILLISGAQKRKESSLERQLNRYFRVIFLFQISVTLLSAILYGIIFGVNRNNQGYIPESGNLFVAALATWGSWFVGFSAFIPISLLVTVEMVRYGQGRMLAKDEQCSSKGQFAEVQTSNMNEQLGQIEYIMTDKTGTLTQNLMQFKCLYVNGEHFGQDEKPRDVCGVESESTDRSIYKGNATGFNQILQKSKIDNVDFSQTERSRILASINSKSNQGNKTRQALIHLSLCHNVITEKGQYSSSSPDELSLVSFAKFIGYQFIQKNDDNELVVRETTSENGEGRMLRYKLLHIIEFSSERKRMSAIVQDLNGEEKRLLLLTKGADEIIIQRTRACDGEEEKESLQMVKLQQALYLYACQGLRTLVLAQKELDRQAYLVWNDRYTDALAIIGPQRYDMIDKLQSDIERELVLVGASAIEDKLQDQVKETITDLKRSNIKVWMLTGDKKQTAISIGFSCGLIDNESERITLDCSAEHAKSLLSNLASMMHLLKHKKVTVVSGEFIRKIDQESRIILERILLDSQSVICCRVSPNDKEFITRMVKRWGITLAVGDGANDVNMITCANVGVGVRGIEGSQATRAADYIVTEFKLLRRLVVYHGLNYYHRNTNVMLYTLYKNMLLTFPNLFYGPLSLESGTYIYEIWIVQLFNILFVAFPIVYYGLFDTLYSYKEIKERPSLYQEGQTRKYFNNKILLRYLLQTLFASIFILYTVFFVTELTLCGKGLMIYREWSGNLVYAIVIICCNVRVVLISHQFNIVQGFFCAIGVILYYLFYFLIGIVVETDSMNTLAHQVSTGIYWVLIIFLCFVVEGVEVVENTISNMKNFIQQRERLIKDIANSSKKEIQMTKVGQPKSLEVVGVEIREREKSQIGGYAFAEDENRNAFDLDYAPKYWQRSASYL